MYYFSFLIAKIEIKYRLFLYNLYWNLNFYSKFLLFDVRKSKYQLSWYFKFQQFITLSIDI